MPGPGEYVPDPTEGVEQVEDLPEPRKKIRRRDKKSARCPDCNVPSPRRRAGVRTLHDFGNIDTGRPVDIEFHYSAHRCPECGKYFSVDMSDIAVDELYDGPFCVLSIVDNRECKRLTYKVLDRAPNAEDIRQRFRSFKKILKKRKLELKGVTTDGSKLCPEPIKGLFPGVPHQVCEFHVLKEVDKAILKAVTSVRRDLKKTKAKRSKRGRPTTKTEQAQVNRNERIQAKITALFDNRFLFVRKELTPKERETLREITKALPGKHGPELRKLREIEDEVCRLFDRRCRTETAIEKPRKLRQRVKRFKDLSQVLSKLESPTLEKSLVFLDDKLLPSTSNAVERGNRRHRKMQKTVYRVRVHGHVEDRIAWDMFRDAHLPGRRKTLLALHLARNK